MHVPVFALLLIAMKEGVGSEEQLERLQPPKSLKAFCIPTLAMSSLGLGCRCSGGIDPLLPSIDTN